MTRQLASALELAFDAAKSNDHNLGPEQRAAIRHVKDYPDEPEHITSLEQFYASLKAARAGKGHVSFRRLREFAAFCSEGSFRIG